VWLAATLHEAKNQKPRERLKKKGPVMTINQPTGAAALREQVLPPIQPDCKVFSLCALNSRAKELRRAGDFVRANLLVDALRAATVGTQYKPS
jgi:hypothetical protein